MRRPRNRACFAKVAMLIFKKLKTMCAESSPMIELLSQQFIDHFELLAATKPIFFEHSFLGLNSNIELMVTVSYKRQTSENSWRARVCMMFYVFLKDDTLFIRYLALNDRPRNSMWSIESHHLSKPLCVQELLDTLTGELEDALISLESNSAWPNPL